MKAKKTKIMKLMLFSLVILAQSWSFAQRTPIRSGAEPTGRPSIPLGAQDRIPGAVFIKKVEEAQKQCIFNRANHDSLVSQFLNQMPWRQDNEESMDIGVYGSFGPTYGGPNVRGWMAYYLDKYASREKIETCHKNDWPGHDHQCERTAKAMLRYYGFPITPLLGFLGPVASRTRRNLPMLKDEISSFLIYYGSKLEHPQVASKGAPVLRVKYIEESDLGSPSRRPVVEFLVKDGVDSRGNSYVAKLVLKGQPYLGYIVASGVGQTDRLGVPLENQTLVTGLQYLPSEEEQNETVLQNIDFNEPSEVKINTKVYGDCIKSFLNGPEAN